MKHVILSNQPAPVKALTIGTCIAGDGLSSRAENTLCACCNKPLHAHGFVRVVFAASKGATGKRTFIGGDCERRPVSSNVTEYAPRLELKVGFKGDPDATLGAMQWALKDQPYEFSPAFDVDGHFAGKGVLTVYAPDNCSAIGKLGKALSVAGVEGKAQRMRNAEGEITEWEPVDTATWAPFMGCGFYHGSKAYNV